MSDSPLHIVYTVGWESVPVGGFLRFDESVGSFKTSNATLVLEQEQLAQFQKSEPVTVETPF